MRKKLTIEELLDWAKSIRANIEIYGDGFIRVRFPPTYARRICGDSLRETLMKARHRVQSSPSLQREMGIR